MHVLRECAKIFDQKIDWLSSCINNKSTCFLKVSFLKSISLWKFFLTFIAEKTLLLIQIFSQLCEYL